MCLQLLRYMLHLICFCVSEECQTGAGRREDEGFGRGLGLFSETVKKKERLRPAEFQSCGSSGCKTLRWMSSFFGDFREFNFKILDPVCTSSDHIVQSIVAVKGVTESFSANMKEEAGKRYRERIGSSTLPPTGCSLSAQHTLKRVKADRRSA